MAELNSSLEVLDLDRKYIKTKLKPYLQKNDMVTVRKIILEDEEYTSQLFLLLNLGEKDYFMGSDEIFGSEFCDFDLISFDIPDTITKIGAGAFGGTTLKVVKVPNSVTEIGDHAFAFNWHITSIQLPNKFKNHNLSRYFDPQVLEKANIIYT